MPRPPARSGFSLIELLTVLVLLSVLATLAVPSLRDAAHRAALRAVLGELTADLYRTRALAARSGRELLVRFERAPDGCVRSYRILDPTVNHVLHAVDLGRGAAGLCLRVSGAPTIRVTARGLPVGAARKVRARLGGVGDSLSISMVGRVYRWAYTARWPARLHRKKLSAAAMISRAGPPPNSLSRCGTRVSPRAHKFPYQPACAHFHWVGGPPASR